MIVNILKLIQIVLIHKIHKNNLPVCKSTDFKSAAISYHWIHVNCKNCQIISRITPKLIKVRNTINSYKRKIEELKITEKQYVSELANEE